MDLQDPELNAEITRSVRDALDEDIGTGDITAQLIAADAHCEASIITREDCVVCGIAWADEVFRQLGNVTTNWHFKDGERASRNTVIGRLSGNARQILTGERTALNFLQLLSGTATQAREFARLAEHTALKILDTRKTIPGLRRAQKYAVKMGGCDNHRLGLFDAFLIKENHIAACGGITQAIERARALHPDKPIIVEVETYAEYCEAAELPVTRIMLDSLSDQDLQQVFAHPGGIPLEISGNIDAQNLESIAKTPVQAISSGALTKHVRAVDLSLRVQMTSASRLSGTDQSIGL